MTTLVRLVGAAGVVLVALASAAAPAVAARAAAPQAAAPQAAAPQAAGPQAAGRPPTVLLADPGSPTTPDRPVAVSLADLQPREIHPDSTVTVTAVLHNTGATTTGPVFVGLNSGAVITTRSDLAAADATPPAIPDFVPAAMPLGTTLAPGQSIRVTYRRTAAALGLVDLGVYPVAFLVRAASPAGDFSTVGRLDTLLPYFPSSAGPTRVAWLWPLLDRPHLLTGDSANPPVFADDGLARSVAAGGRLDQLLAAVERLPPAARVTLVVDPETIAELRLMTRAYRVAHGTGTVTGRAGAAARDWLARLRATATRQLVAAVPYGDPDTVALIRAGLGALGQPDQSDLDALDAELGVAATARLVWPPGGVLTDTALDAVVAQGASAVVLDPASLAGAANPDTQGFTQNALSPLPALSGQAYALVTDAAIERIVAAAGSWPGGARVAEQRYLAELAMITAEQPNLPRTLVVTPPRRWTPPPGLAAAMLADTARLPWLSSLTAADVTNSQPVDRGALVYPPAASRDELPAGTLAKVGTVQTLVTDFRTALANSDANQLLSPFSNALRRACSAAWRTDPAGGLAYANQLRAQIGTLRSRVSIVVPKTGVYSLASSDSPLSLTIVNQLDRTVRIRVQFATTMVAGFSTTDVGVREIPAGSRATLRVPAKVRRSGTFSVQAQLTTPAGLTLGREVTLTVRSTAYGALALSITGAAFAILVGAVVVRMIRRLGAGPDRPATPAGTPADRRLR